MLRWRTRRAAAALAAALLAGGTLAGEDPRPEPRPAGAAPLPGTVPAPEDNPTTPEKAALGRELFFDPRLSGGNRRSCATCHRPDLSYGDGLPRGVGAGGQTLRRNTPSLLNVGYCSTLLWDGRARSLEEQALLVLRSPEEMDQDLDELERELNAVPRYRERFRAVFAAEPTREGVARALAAFQRTLVTWPSPYDRYLAGDEAALSAEARKGMDLFFGEAGCARCHRGPLLSDEQFHRLGISRDRGRGSVTGKAGDDYRIRTPPLRNVAATGPYMHDGSHRTLEDVIQYYYRGAPATGPDGLPLDIQPLLGNSFSEVSALEAFLLALTGGEPEASPGPPPGAPTGR